MPLTVAYMLAKLPICSWRPFHSLQYFYFYLNFLLILCKVTEVLMYFFTLNLM